VVSHCIYGVDLNPMAVELCKVSLWIEALEPGKPLSFLDHLILCGNSLLGTTPALMTERIPDDAFEPIEGDDKKVAQSVKKENRTQRKGQMTIVAEPLASYQTISGAFINSTRLKTIRSPTSTRRNGTIGSWPSHHNIRTPAFSLTPGAPPSCGRRPRALLPPSLTISFSGSSATQNQYHVPLRRKSSAWPTNSASSTGISPSPTSSACQDRESSQKTIKLACMAASTWCSGIRRGSFSCFASRSSFRLYVLTLLMHQPAPRGSD
jgi:hypothetical protein